MSIEFFDPKVYILMEYVTKIESSASPNINFKIKIFRAFNMMQKILPELLTSSSVYRYHTSVEEKPHLCTTLTLEYAINVQNITIVLIIFLYYSAFIIGTIVLFSTVPELRSRCSKRERYTKLHYINRTAQVQRLFLLAGELASPAAEI